jgi:tRNA-specific 2-thiouridylase
MPHIMPTNGTKVLLAMSGGVDSSVAAALLLQRGYDVVGCFMRLGSPGETFDELLPADGPDACDGRIKIGHQGCCSINDAADARLVAARLQVPFYVCNFKRDFGRIINYFVDEYNAGRTPNPCVRCNDWLKFGRLHDYARQIGATHVASGHHARVDRGPDGQLRLRCGVDAGKDQSYVLFGAQREQLGEMLLPVGEYQKSQIRAMARKLDLPVFDKPDSQEICFVPDNDYAGLLKQRSPERIKPGRIVDTDGRDIGAHQGHQHFTIGQRRGLRLAVGQPLYVIDKNAQDNTVTVGPREALQAGACTAREANWLRDAPGDPEAWIGCTARIRYNAQAVAAHVRAPSAETLQIRFEQPQLAVAPGQAVVCYHQDVVICGGWIDQVSKSPSASDRASGAQTLSPTVS